MICSTKLHFKYAQSRDKRAILCGQSNSVTWNFCIWHELFCVQVPKSLSSKQKALMYAYAELEEDTPGQIHGVSLDRDGKK